MLPLNYLLDRISQSPSWPVQPKVISLLRNYAGLVGFELSKNTTLKWIKNGTACIHCRSSMWSFALSCMEEELKKKMNDFAGEVIVKQLLLRVGNVSKEPKKEKKREKLSTNELEWIEELVSRIPPPLQESFQRLLNSYKELQRP